MNKKILFLINNLNLGGAENVFVEQANYLFDQGYQVYFGVLSDTNKADFKNKLKIKPINFAFDGILDLLAYRRLAKFIKGQKINCVYSTLDNANVAARVANIFNHQTYVVIRESGMADRKSGKIKILDKFLNNFVDKIIAVSSEVKDSLLAYQAKHANKIEVFTNGVELPFTEEGLEEVLSAKDDSSINILCVGSMKDDNKGQAGLIRTVGSIRQTNPELNIKLILVSDGKLRPELETLAENHAIAGRVLFTGYLDKDKINNWYKSADIYILNSRNEGCPNVVLEAMSYGLPVIATKVGGTREMIADGVSGFLLKRGDYSKMKELIVALAKDRNRRFELGREAYHKIEREFLWSDKMQELIVILRLN
ncbi:glycosyltransferase [Candidatus Parcubacteria bacterium]|nr:MAG: glycosyltransferase [Candidatus Parcubacteria bacterium]